MRAARMLIKTEYAVIRWYNDGEALVLFTGWEPFYAQPRAEELSRKGGARGARRVGEKTVPLLDCAAPCRGTKPESGARVGEERFPYLTR